MADEIFLSRQYWDQRYREKDTGWDIGQASPAILRFFDTQANRNLRILIPGCGNAWEGEALRHRGFHNVFLLDISRRALDQVHERFPEIPDTHLIHDDFFAHSGTYDLIIEQTFFCALHPSMRTAYVQHCVSLLGEEGRVTGLLFASRFEQEGPPFGGNREEYVALFSTHFDILTMEISKHSIGPRLGNELFFVMQRKKK